MSEIWEGHGLRFAYPETWELEEQSDPGQLALTLTSPRTAFWSLMLYFDSPDPEEVLETILSTFEEEYPELDIYPSDAVIDEAPTLARDIDFVCQELLNSAWVRVFVAEEFTGVVLWQGYHGELADFGEEMQAMTRSLECDRD